MGAFTLLYFVIGFAIEEQALVGRAVGSEIPKDNSGLIDKYPLAAIAMREIMEANADARFTFGLEQQVAALKGMIDGRLLSN